MARIQISQEEVELIRKSALAEVDRLTAKLKDTINSYFLRFKTDDIHTWTCYRGNTAHTGVVGPAIIPPEGEPAFEYEIGEGVATGPSLTQTHLVTPAAGGEELHCVALETGERAWKAQLDGKVSCPAAIGWDGYVYVACDDLNLYSVGIESGLLRWKYLFDDLIQLTPCVEGPNVFLVTQEGFLLALDATQSSLKWISPWESAFSEPTAGTGAIYLSTYDGCLMSVYMGSGDIRWKTRSFGNAGSSPTYYDNKLYFAIPETVGELEDKPGSQRPYLIVIDAATGKLLWRYETIASLTCTPAIAEGRVFTVAQNYLEAVSSDGGNRLWRVSTETPIRHSPVVTDNAVFVTTRDGILHGFDVAKGEELWRHQLEAPAVDGPCFAAGRLVVSCENGMLYAFK
jgi:outer membrane protein assembly factor BamB